MSDYPLKDFAKFVAPYYSGEAYGVSPESKIGILVECPHCGMLGGAYFKNPINGGQPQGRTLWQRTGETLETLTLTPSFLFIDHFHSWIRDGKLCVDSPFSCKPKAERLAEEERLRREIAERSKC